MCERIIDDEPNDLVGIARWQVQAMERVSRTVGIALIDEVERLRARVVELERERFKSPAPRLQTPDIMQSFKSHRSEYE